MSLYEQPTYTPLSRAVPIVRAESATTRDQTFSFGGTSRVPSVRGSVAGQGNAVERNDVQANGERVDVPHKEPYRFDLRDHPNELGTSAKPLNELVRDVKAFGERIGVHPRRLSRLLSCTNWLHATLLQLDGVEQHWATWIGKVDLFIRGVHRRLRDWYRLGIVGCLANEETIMADLGAMQTEAEELGISKHPSIMEELRAQETENNLLDQTSLYRSLIDIVSDDVLREKVLLLRGGPADKLMNKILKALDPAPTPATQSIAFPATFYNNATTLLSSLTLAVMKLPTGMHTEDMTDRSSRVLNKGRNFEVYGAERAGRALALKVARRPLTISSSNDVDMDLFRRISHHALLLLPTSVRHPHILEFLGVTGQYNPPQLSSEIQIPALVSPWMVNGSVLEYAKAHEDVNRIRLLAEVASALGYLHAKGIVHGSLRCENVLISESGHTQLTGFSRASPLSSQNNGSSDVNSLFTRTTLSIVRDGVVRWTSPRALAQPASLSTSADSWAFGMSILELMTESTPWKDTILDEVVAYNLMNGLLPTFEQHSKSIWRRRGLDRELWDIVIACWVSVSDFTGGFSGMSEAAMKLEGMGRDWESGGRDAARDAAYAQLTGGEAVESRLHDAPSVDHTFSTNMGLGHGMATRMGMTPLIVPANVRTESPPIASPHAGPSRQPPTLNRTPAWPQQMIGRQTPRTHSENLFRPDSPGTALADDAYRPLSDFGGMGSMYGGSEMGGLGSALGGERKEGSTYAGSRVASNAGAGFSNFDNAGGFGGFNFNFGGAALGTSGLVDKGTGNVGGLEQVNRGSLFTFDTLGITSTPYRVPLPMSPALSRVNLRDSSAFGDDARTPGQRTQTLGEGSQTAAGFGKTPQRHPLSMGMTMSPVTTRFGRETLPTVEEGIAGMHLDPHTTFGPGAFGAGVYKSPARETRHVSPIASPALVAQDFGLASTSKTPQRVALPMSPAPSKFIYEGTASPAGFTGANNLLGTTANYLGGATPSRVALPLSPSMSHRPVSPVGGGGLGDFGRTPALTLHELRSQPRSRPVSPGYQRSPSVNTPVIPLVIPLSPSPSQARERSTRWAHRTTELRLAEVDARHIAGPGGISKGSIEEEFGVTIETFVKDESTETEEERLRYAGRNALWKITGPEHHVDNAAREIISRVRKLTVPVGPAVVSETVKVDRDVYVSREGPILAALEALMAGYGIVAEKSAQGGAHWNRETGEAEVDIVFSGKQGPVLRATEEFRKMIDFHVKFNSATHVDSPLGLASRIHKRGRGWLYEIGNSFNVDFDLHPDVDTGAAVGGHVTVRGPVAGLEDAKKAFLSHFGVDVRRKHETLRSHEAWYKFPRKLQMHILRLLRDSLVKYGRKIAIAPNHELPILTLDSSAGPIPGPGILPTYIPTRPVMDGTDIIDEENETMWQVRPQTVEPGEGEVLWRIMCQIPDSHAILSSVGELVRKGVEDARWVGWLTLKENERKRLDRVLNDDSDTGEGLNLGFNLPAEIYDEHGNRIRQKGLGIERIATECKVDIMFPKRGDLWHCTVVFIGSRDGIEEAMRRIKGVIRRLGTMSQNFI